MSRDAAHFWRIYTNQVCDKYTKRLFLTSTCPQIFRKDNELLPTAADLSHILGIRWNYRADTVVVSRSTSPDLKTAITQQAVLSAVSSVYNPIGLVAPYTVKTRLLREDIWRMNEPQWDDDLP